MSGDLLALAKFIEGKADKVKDVAHELKQEAATAMLVHLVRETPVDTSQALSNWQIGNGVPVIAEIPPYVRGLRGSTAGASQDAAIAEGKERIARSKPGEPIYLSNLLPYIRRLNNGWSKQHPGGFVQSAMMIGRELIRTVRLVRLRK